MLQLPQLVSSFSTSTQLPLQQAPGWPGAKWQGESSL
jgi:hypothetical protein